ncbi:MAG: hypothetical protein A3C53_05580 [Omnitrophica WOR_2 bacterium RIFCSPHIGHO2_02_FULL_68_15]|nr:MAG: hypothetical protein A3C53_05580 [Omnitrophica WOR_2 bacterium RIFCSPHIGHO2_02_FULL_68_15]
MALAVAPAWAASGDPEAYGVTITRIELSKDGGASYVTRFEGYADVNLAAPGVGAPIADLGKDTPLPKGTYNRLRVTLGPTLYLKGYVNHGGATLFTNGGADLVGYETNAAAANAPGATYAVSSVTIPNTARTFEQAIDIHVGSTMPALHLAFDLTGLITQTAGVPAVSAPAVILELEAA